MLPSHHVMRPAASDPPDPQSLLHWPNTLTIPPTAHDNDKSAMPIVRTSGRATGGDRTVEPHKAGTDTLTTRHPNPQPVSLARSNLLRCSNDEDWGAPPLPGAYYNDDDIALSYSLELEYLNNPMEPYTEPQ
jgi:hypothetical protein